MAGVQYILLYSIKKMGLILSDPIFYFILFAVSYLYKRQLEKIHEKKLGFAPIRQMIKSNCIGILIGIIISGILAYKGITIVLTMETFVLMPIAIGLMCIRSKWGCFSYTVSVAYMIEGLLRLAHLPTYTLPYGTLIFLVGALHLIEGILIILMGHQGGIQLPIYEAGKLKKKYVYNQMWLLPLICQVETMTLPVYMVLAYGDVATYPKQKYITGRLVILYGLLILGIHRAVINGGVPIGAVMILMPVLHECIFILGHEPLKKRTKKETISS
ncbi:MAG: hypothetical protein ACRDDX_11765 [Cellulosilyticaceae bacterium]